MDKVRTAQVARYWKCDESACNAGAQFWTDGAKLYSYKLCIGYTDDDGQKWLKDYSASGAHGFQSMTTSKHVGYARQYADVVS